MSEQEIADVLNLYPRPRKRGDCLNGPRPCPYVSCRYHLHLDVRGEHFERVAPLPPEEMKETCALDVADRGESTLEAVGEIMGVTRERIRQIEAIVLRRLRVSKRHGIREAIEALAELTDSKLPHEERQVPKPHRRRAK